MPEITVTETQRERLSAIQSELETAFIDTYGHVPLEDTVQYLLDTYTPPEQVGDEAARERIATAEYQLLQEVATEVEGVPGSGIDTETMRGELLSTLGVAEFAARLDALEAGAVDDSEADSDAAPGSEGPDASVGAADSDPDEAGGAEEATPATDGAADSMDSDTAGDGEDGGGADSGESGSAPGADGPGSILSAANQLLTDHEDKWRDGGSDEPYEVDLPDGTTEKVRTKDDVRGLLFKHY